MQSPKFRQNLLVGHSSFELAENSSLVVAAYECLINRTNPLTAEDMEGLALNDIANIISMRETQRFTVGMKPVSHADI